MKKTEEKARAYDEALERWKAKQEYESKEVHRFIEYLFPELKVSEDEKIRKELIEFVKSRGGFKQEYIAWLEKQGENNMGISEATKQKLEDNLNKALEKETPESLNEFLEKQGEQKPAEWSEEDEKMYQSALWHIKNSCGNGGKNSGEFEVYNWLKSLHPQKQCGYNPYKAVVESIAEMCEHYGKVSIVALRDFYDNVKVKCKDAKEYGAKYPQKQWKPSDAQMEALKTVCEFHTGAANVCLRNILYSLYNDLKQL